jgi:membrane-associated protein
VVNERRVWYPTGTFPRENDDVDSLMKLFHQIYDVQGLIQWGGLLGLVLIVFAETGLLIGFFLPGDSLLVTAGIFCTSSNPLGRPLLSLLWVNILVSLAAIVGDTVGYWIGAKSGPRLFNREDSLFFSKKHLMRTKAFYDRHGGKTIIIARFMPIVRTFAPVVAGMGQMNYKRFLTYNVFGGIFWVGSMTLTGYGLATAWPEVTKHIEKLIIVIIFLSLLPAMIGGLRGYLAKRKEQAGTAGVTGG